MKRVTAELILPSLSTLLVLALAALYPIDNADTFGHLAAGRQIVQLGHVPLYDTFSYFRSTPVRFVNYEWLSDWLMFVLYDAGGAAALHALKLGLLAIVACALVRIAQLRAAPPGPWLVPLLVLAGLPVVRFRLSVRPHLFGITLAACCVLGLTHLLNARSRRQQLAWVTLLAGLHVFWVNLHGSHLFGLALVSLAALSCISMRDQTRLVPIGTLLGLMLLASCISPYGPAIASGAIAHVFDPAYRVLIQEWQAWPSSRSRWYPAILTWVALCSCWALWLRRPGSDSCRTFEGLYTLLLLLMAARSLRFGADAVLLSAPVIAGGLAPWWSERAHWQRALGCSAAMTMAVAGCLVMPPQRSFGFGESTRGRPAASAAWLAEHAPKARILAPMNDAWDLMFSLPQAKFLLDGRAPLYGAEHIRRVQRAWSSGPALRALIDETGTDVVIAQPTIAEEQVAVGALLRFADFALVSIEAEHCVFARKTPERAAMLQRASLHSLQPSYDPAWLWSPARDRARIETELAGLPVHPNVVPYRDWVEGISALAPLLREQGRAGLRAPRDEAERKRLRQVVARLRASDQALSLVQTVSLWHALAAVCACELSDAEDAFQRARAQGSVRELLFGEQELALRRGDLAQVRAFVASASLLPEAAHDPWVAALQQALVTPPRCPAPQ